MKQEEALEIIKNWQVKVPSYIERLTPLEAYIQGFSSGYECKLADLRIETPNIMFLEELEKSEEKHDE